MKLVFGTRFYVVPEPPESWVSDEDGCHCRNCRQRLSFKFNTLPYTEPDQVKCECFTLDLQPTEETMP